MFLSDVFSFSIVSSLRVRHNSFIYATTTLKSSPILPKPTACETFRSGYFFVRIPCLHDAQPCKFEIRKKPGFRQKNCVGHVLPSKKNVLPAKKTAPCCCHSLFPVYHPKIAYHCVVLPTTFKIRCQQFGIRTTLPKKTSYNS